MSLSSFFGGKGGDADRNGSGGGPPGVQTADPAPPPAPPPPPPPPTLSMGRDDGGYGRFNALAGSGAVSAAPT